MKTCILLFCLFLIFVSCQKENGIKKGSSDFSLGDTLLKVNESLAILNPSESMSLSYRWDFGDGFSSYEKNPEHHYLQPGKYDIKLTISDKFGNAESTSHQVRVGEFFVYEIIISSLDQDSGYPDFHNWDEGKSPDIYVRINEFNGSVLYESNTINNIDFNILPISIMVPDVKINYEITDGIETEISINDMDDSTSEQIFSNLWSGANHTGNIYDKANHTGKFTCGFYGNSFIVKYIIK